MPSPARITRIDDAADPRIAGFRDIRERDLRRRTGRFVVEGTVVLRVLSEVHGGPGGFTAESVLVLENRLAGVGPIVDAFPPDVPIYVASRAVIDAIAGFAMHRGVLALARCAHGADSADRVVAALPRRAIVVVAQAIANHDNVGAIFRNAAALGADAVLLDRQCCDPLYRKAIRVSVGGVMRMPFARGGSMESILDCLAAAGFDLWGLSPRGATPIDAVPVRDRTALVLGTEGEGLPPAILQRLHSARIAQAPGMDSLNVATALAIALSRVAESAHRLV